MQTTSPWRERMVRFATAAITLAASLIGVTARAQQLQLLDFWSPQCGPCMQMKPIVHSCEQAGYPIRTVDTTRDGQLSQQYGVSSIPCFVMLVNGRETERQVGAIGSDGLKQMFERAKDEAQRQGGVRGQSPDQAPQAPRSQPAPPANNAAVGPAQQPADQAWPTKNPAPIETPLPPPNGNLASGAAAPVSHAALLSATVRLIIEDPTGRSYGTGTVVDT